ncbi:hypothetical protein I0C86_29430 [Plantactinospora sp. S1510]|uniref:Immunity protein 51 n=1 Tax=Plantactinospora alkalitolerans TaxID=2789879 RepID=A0ABS0H3L5_9ACTN|nr:hypothetical protein [Plantactinospora alkalitolerans]
MEPIRVAEIKPGEYSLCLVAGATDVDDLIVELGHEPNGEFWAGIAELLVMTEASALAGAFSPDPEGGAFYAYSDDRGVLNDLANRLRLVATDGNRLRQLMDFADANGFEFDD